MQHFLSIHYLRGIAAVIVVIFHICTTFPSLDPKLDDVFWLQAGVDIFFIISGFVMISSVNTKSKSSINFIADRIIRIVPIYWLISIFCVFFVSSNHIDMLLPSMFFVPVYNPETGHLVSAIIPPAWTLNLELFFYFIFAILLNLSYARKIIIFLLLFSLLMTINLIIPSRALGFYANPIIIEFWLGMVLARYHHCGRFWMLPIGVASLYLSTSAISFSLLPFAPGAFLVVAGMLSMEKRMKDLPSLRLLGDASYVLYLVHMMIIVVAGTAFSGLLDTSPLLFLLAILFLSIAVAFVVHLFVEKPLITVIKKWLAGHRDPPRAYTLYDGNAAEPATPTVSK